MLELVEPVDEFSSAVCMIRDCMADDLTLRALAIKKLRVFLRARLNLVATYQAEIAQHGGIENIRPDTFENLRAAFKSQMDRLHGRK